MNDIKKLGQLAGYVAEGDARYKSAIAAERSAKATILAAAIDVVRPALEAISSLDEEYGVRGVCLSDPPRQGPRKALFLFPDGSLAVLSEPGATMRSMSVEEAIAERFDVGAACEYLSDAVAAQLDGKKLERTEKIERNAARLQAVATLLKKKG